MVHLTKRTVNKRTYYYLEHSIREGKQVRKEEKYLGGKVPKDVEGLKKAFLAEIHKKQWYPLLESVRKNYSRETSRTPKSVSSKESKTFSVRFTYDTNRMEGSRLTYRETADLLERGITPKSKPLDDVLEAAAHDRAFLEALKHKKSLNMHTLVSWHRKLFHETKPDIAGKIRDYQVAISGSRHVPPAPVEVYPLMREYFRWYDKNKRTLNPVELACLAHLKLVTVHPFGDGNGRISRLVMNHILHNAGYPMINIPYENRTSYYNALERAQTKRQDNIFVHWFIKKYLNENRRYAKK